jgi:hypothetical protein
MKRITTISLFASGLAAVAVFGLPNVVKAPGDPGDPGDPGGGLHEAKGSAVRNWSGGCCCAERR